MKKKKLSQSDLYISELTLGTLGFGSKVSEPDAHKQLDYAIECGINVVDTAEIYPAPFSPELFGISEKIIGSWLKKNKFKRQELVIATKCSGPGAFVKWVRNGKSMHNCSNITLAVNGSLKRLKTDYIDLLQLHWPDRAVSPFSTLYKIPREESTQNIEKTIEAILDLKKSGKVRFFGTCNETPWGLMKLNHTYPDLVSVQHPFNLLNRTFEKNHAEIIVNENLGFFAYSPLAMGLLTNATGNNIKDIDKHRKELRRKESKKIKMISEFKTLAQTQNISLSALALRFVASLPFISSTIIGNSTIQQLKENITDYPQRLDGKTMKKINTIYLEGLQL